MRVLLFATLVVFASACGASADHPAATPTPSITVTPVTGTPTSIASTPTAVREATASATATGIATAASTPRVVLTSTATPGGVRVWDVPPITGIAEVDGIIKAMTTGDIAALETYRAGMVQTLPCTTTPNGSGEVRCLAGTASGTPPRAILYVPGCHGEYWEIATASPSIPGSSTLTELAARITGSAKFVWMMSGRSGDDHETLLFLDDRVSPKGGIGILLEGGRARSFSTAVPGCTSAKLHELPDLIVNGGGRLIISPPP